MNDLLKEFDLIIEEAPLDFLGTGESLRFANQCEKEWYNMVRKFREKLSDLIEENKQLFNDLDECARNE